MLLVFNIVALVKDLCIGFLKKERETPNSYLEILNSKLQRLEFVLNNWNLVFILTSRLVPKQKYTP